jgi:hypothetical protein
MMFPHQQAGIFNFAAYIPPLIYRVYKRLERV